MKKLLSGLCAILLTCGLLTGCGQTETGSPAVDESIAESHELALVTDTGEIDDESFTQATWEGLKKYGEDLGISYGYYRPDTRTTKSLLDSIDLAVANGAKVIVCTGDAFIDAIEEAQELYPEVCFVLLDAAPDTIAPNTYCIHYAEEQAGFLAGYAVASDGYTNLGFIGGQNSPPVIRYGYGFVSGANAAAREMHEEINFHYCYADDQDSFDAIQTEAADWYEDGVEVIFGCGDDVCLPVIAAAEAAEGWAVGADLDWSAESEAVLTSAMKDLGNSVYNALVMYYGGQFPGGREVTLDAAHTGVALPLAFSHFEEFNRDDYMDIFSRLAAKKIEVPVDTDALTIADLELSHIRLVLE